MQQAKARLLTWLTAAQRQSTSWIPKPLRLAIRRLSGGESWTAQVVRGWLWRYRYFVLLALGANLAAAVFEGSTLGVLTLALELLAGTFQPGESAGQSLFSDLIAGWQQRWGVGGAFFLLLGIAAAMQIARSGLDFSAQVASAYLRAWLEGELRRQIFRQFVSLHYPAISRYRTGDLVSYTEQVANVGRLITTTNYLLSHLLIVVAYAVVLFWLSWQMTLGALVVLLLLSIALRGIMARVRQISRQLLEASVQFNTQVVEFLQGLRLIHSFARQEHAIRQVDQIVDRSIRAQRRGMIWAASILPVMQVLMVLGVVIFLAIGYQMVQRVGVGMVPRLITFVFVLYRLLPRVSGVNNGLAQINGEWPFVERVAEILRTDDKEYVHSGELPFQRLEEGIRFDGVTLTYPGSTRPAVHNLSFTIPRGSMVAFVGTSGAGKSTLVNLLLRLYDPDTGHIWVDGKDLKRLRLTDWRERIGVVDQDTFVFSTTIAENIRFGRLDADDGAVRRAAQMAQAHEFIAQLPAGYETEVGDRGYRLSGGQRQRLAIARAVIREPEILIFDEATSALDSRSERLIQAAMGELRQDRTLVVIAHRLSTVVDADQIYVLQDGRVVEQGTHPSLLAAGGLYASLWRIQAGSAPAHP